MCGIYKYKDDIEITVGFSGAVRIEAFRVIIDFLADNASITNDLYEFEELSDSEVIFNGYRCGCVKRFLDSDISLLYEKEKSFIKSLDLEDSLKQLALSRLALKLSKQSRERYHASLTEMKDMIKSAEEKGIYVPDAAFTGFRAVGGNFKTIGL